MALRLHSRLVALNVAALAAMTLLLAFFFSGRVKETFETEVESQLYSSANLAKTYISEHPEVGRQQLAATIAQQLGVRVTIIAADGRVLGDSGLDQSGVGEMENHSQRPEFIEAHSSGRGVAIRESATLGISFIYVATALDNGDILRLAMPLASVETLLSGLRRQLTFGMIVAVSLVFLFGYMVYAVVSRPLMKMADASQRLAIGDLDSEIPVTGDRDLARVGSSLNAMAKNLRRKMDELESDRRQTEAIIEAMSAGVVVFDAEAKVILANRSIHALLALHGGAAGRAPMELVRHPPLAAAVREALAGADPPALDFTTSGGRILLAKAAPLRVASGNVELVVAVFHDLTDIRRTEKMRRDFVANVSHEFKTPLTSIRGYAETLVNADRIDPEDQKEFLEAIERNATVLQALVEDLLLLSQLEREAPVERVRIDLRELLEQELKSKERLLAEKNVIASVDSPAIEIHVDRWRLSRALSNLIDNAIQYNRPGGRLSVTASAIDRGVRIDVEDSGVGIPREDLHRIFERFYRVDKARTRNLGGTGLGLAIAKHAIESQGGSLSVVSKLGSGSTFSIILPNG